MPTKQSNTLRGTLRSIWSELCARSSLVWFLFGVVLVGVDLGSRLFCFRYCHWSLSRFFGLHPFKNALFAFSVPVPPVLMYGIYLIVLSALCVYVVHTWPLLAWRLRLAWVLIVSGALANVGERIVSGYVRDFIQVGTGYLNLGDVYILVGVTYLLYHNSMRASIK